MKYTKYAVALTVGIALGVLFIFVPTQNTEYKGPPAPLAGICEGANNLNDAISNYPPPGVKKIGIPVTNKTELTGYCVEASGVNIEKATLDFLTGLIIGAVLTTSVLRISKIVREK